MLCQDRPELTYAYVDWFSKAHMLSLSKGKQVHLNITLVLMVNIFLWLELQLENIIQAAAAVTMLEPVVSLLQYLFQSWFQQYLT